MPINGAIDVVSIIIPPVVAAASEAEYAGLFINGQNVVSILNTLCDLGYPQYHTPIVTDDTTSAGIANKTSKIRRSKAIDMRFHWIRDRVAQGQYKVHGQSKTHPVKHHQRMRTLYVGPWNNIRKIVFWEGVF